MRSDSTSNISGAYAPLSMEMQENPVSNESSSSSTPPPRRSFVAERPVHPSTISTLLLAELENARSDVSVASPTQEAMQAAFEQGLTSAKRYIDDVPRHLAEQFGELAFPDELAKAYQHHDQQAWQKMKPDLDRAFEALNRVPASRKNDREKWLDARSAHYQVVSQEALNKAFADAGWPTDAESAKWEEESPLIMRRGCKTAPLTVLQKDIHAGEHGALSIVGNDDGFSFGLKIALGKRSKSGPDLLGDEFDGYKHVYENAGLHRNLMNVFGLCQFQMDGKSRRALMMDAIKGPNGDATFATLRHCRDNGTITKAEFLQAMKFVTRRLLQVAAHLKKAGVVHNDIKPANIIFDDTGEPILGDLGLWSLANDHASGTTAMYGPPEARSGVVDARSDVFAICATLVDAMEGGELFLKKDGRATQLYPNGGMAVDAQEFADTGESMRSHPALAGEEPYNRFVSGLLNPEISERPQPEDALHLEFLTDGAATNASLQRADEDQARATILKAISLMA